MRRQLHFLAAVLPLVCLLVWAVARLGPARAADEPKIESRGGGGSKAWSTAVEPKPLSPSVKKGLGWLVEHQLRGGGWGQGEESLQMRGGTAGNEALRDTPNVADTCIAALALIRSGGTPREGLYRDAIRKAVDYVRSQVEQSDSQSLAVSGIQGTRVQQKLGPNIDAFLASMLLAEVKGRMPDARSEQSVDVALHKVLSKIEHHQKQDGTFDGQGWAPILAQAMCGKGINRARQAGARVSDRALARAQYGAKLALEASRPSAARSGVGTRSAETPSRMAMMGGSAGVELYSVAAGAGGLQDSVNTGQAELGRLRKQAATSKDRKEREEAQAKIGKIADAQQVNDAARAGVVSRLGDAQFMAGFGSNGGEEFLSYMNIAESLVVKGGEEWKKWDAEMTGNLTRVQNDDGSWSGHHCITGRTFCTSTALLVLMADRTPVPIAAKGDAKASAK